MAASDHRGELAAAPDVSHVLETSLYVENLATSCEFYQRVFGFPVIFEDARMCALKIPASGVLLLFRIGGSLSPSEMPGGTIPPHGGAGPLHLCFAIPLASLQGWIDHLETKAVPLESRVTQHFGGTSLYFRDPDGHSIEVSTPGLWPNY